MDNGDYHQSESLRSSASASYIHFAQALSDNIMVYTIHTNEEEQDQHSSVAIHGIRAN